ncbi:MAG: putative signal transducing protein [Gammaproteobacteria bacterium]
MRNVFVAASLADASLVANLLRENGIESQTVEKLRGNIGSPYTEVWVVNDGEGDRAVRLIERLNTEPGTGAAWTCSQCGEENPSSFSICWNCSLEPTADAR